MDAIYHRRVLARSIGALVSPRALAAITEANLGQDNLAGLIAHPEYHFDGSLFERSLAYIEENRALAARARTPAEAWAAFGRLSHAAQDFYSHSNYVALWMERFALTPGPSPVGKNADRRAEPLPPINSIDGLDPALLKHSRLISARVYWPLEALYFIPGLGPAIKAVLPKDSHAWMNLDKPATGPLFPYSIEAAVQRTRVEFERTRAAIGEARGESGMREFQDL